MFWNIKQQFNKLCSPACWVDSGRTGLWLGDFIAYEILLYWLYYKYYTYACLRALLARYFISVAHLQISRVFFFKSLLCSFCNASINEGCKSLFSHLLLLDHYSLLNSVSPSQLWNLWAWFFWKFIINVLLRIIGVRVFVHVREILPASGSDQVGIRLENCRLCWIAGVWNCFTLNTSELSAGASQTARSVLTLLTDTSWCWLAVTSNEPPLALCKSSNKERQSISSESKSAEWKQTWIKETIWQCIIAFDDDTTVLPNSLVEEGFLAQYPQRVEKGNSSHININFTVRTVLALWPSSGSCEWMRMTPMICCWGLRPPLTKRSWNNQSYTQFKQIKSFQISWMFKVPFESSGPQTFCLVTRQNKAMSICDPSSPPEEVKLHSNSLEEKKNESKVWKHSCCPQIVCWLSMSFYIFISRKAKS